MNVKTPLFTCSFALIACLAGCGSDTATSRDTPSTTGNVTAADAPSSGASPGDLIVYATSTSTSAGGTWTTAHTYDTDRQRDVGTLTIADRPQLTLDSARHEVVFFAGSADGIEIRAADVLAGEQRTVYRVAPGTQVRGMPGAEVLLSPDGTALALIETIGASPTDDIITIDLRSGTRHLVASLLKTPDHGNRGPLHVRQWRSDGRGILVSGIDNSVGGQWDTVNLDGTIVEHPITVGFPSPNGRLFVDDGSNMVGCIALTKPEQTVTITDLDANTVVSEIHDPRRGYVDREWAPDGESLLLTHLDATKNDPNECVPEYDAASTTYVLMKSGQPLESVDDPWTLRRKWFVGHDIRVTCESNREAFTPTKPAACPAPTENQILTIDGVEVGHGEDVQLLGIIPRS